VFIKLVPVILALRKDRILWIAHEGKGIDEKRFRRNAQRILNTCISLGPVFIKFGQWLSSRADILPQPYLEELSKLQDSVPAASFDKVRPIIEKDIGKIEEKFDDLDNIMVKYAKVQDEFQILGGYDVEARAREVLSGLGFSEERMSGEVGVLSGGWKMRVALAGILIQLPDLLLLDEPTNHLDIESILWLEGFIRDYKGTVVMTCHDHEFMNRVVDKIVEIDQGKLRVFPGDYDFYLAQRELEDSQRQAAFVRQQAHVERELKWIDSFRAKAHSSSQAQSRLKRLDKLDIIEPPRSRRQKLVFNIDIYNTKLA
jgi:ATPase subunit of ABC transporter with duplicated ATPase domains